MEDKNLFDLHDSYSTGDSPLFNRTESMRDCSILMSLNLGLDTYDIQDIENYLKKSDSNAVHCYTEDDVRVVWTYDSVNEDYLCRDDISFHKESVDDLEEGRKQPPIINQHLNNIRRRN